MFVITLLLAWMLKLWSQVTYTQVVPAQFANQVSPIPSVLPLEGWTSCLQQLSPFNYGCLYALLVTDSKTIAEYQWSTAAATFGADATKRKDIACFLMTMSGWLSFHLVIASSVVL